MDMLSKTGSVKRAIVSPDLLEERAKCGFDQAEFRLFVHGGEAPMRIWSRMMKTYGEDPELRNTLEFNDLTPTEMHENLWKRMKVMYEKHREEFFGNSMFEPPNVDMAVYF